MNNLPHHTHTMSTTSHNNKTTTHTWTTPKGTWTLEIWTSPKTALASITGPDTLIKRTWPDVDERENEQLLQTVGAIPVTVIGIDPAAFTDADKPTREQLDKLVTANLRVYDKSDAAKLIADALAEGRLVMPPSDTLEREFAAWQPKPRPPADRCVCVGECKNCRADKLGETFESWADLEPYLIGGIKAHLFDSQVDWVGTDWAQYADMGALVVDIANLMARYFRDHFDIDSVEKRDWKPADNDPTSVDEFFTARDHPVRVRTSGAYDPPGAWLSTNRSNYGAHLSVDEVRRTILALARAAQLTVGIVPITTVRNLTTLAEQMNVPAEVLDMPVGYNHFVEWLRGGVRDVDPGNPWAAPAPLPEPGGSQASEWARLTLPSDGLEMAGCPDRMNEIAHDAHSWADGVLKIRYSKIWWCFGYQPDTLTAELKEEPE